MHVFIDSKVALREAVTRPRKRLSPWEIFDLAEPERILVKPSWLGNGTRPEETAKGDQLCTLVRREIDKE